MSNFNNTQTPFTVGQWGMPQMPQLNQFQLPDAPMADSSVMGVGQASTGYLPSGLSTGSYGPDMAGAGGGYMDSLGSFFKGAMGTKEAPGWGGMAMGAASGIASAYMGMKQYGLAKDTFEQHKAEYAANYAAQRSTTNTNLQDRQAARVASNPGAYQSVGAYMNQNGIK